MQIQIPYNWEPYPWQLKVIEALEAGVKRIAVVAHRRAGKDALALNLAAIMAHHEVGSYYHVFPFAVQGRKALWRGSSDDGVRFLDQAFPREIRKVTRDQEMSIEFLNGSVWQCIGADNPNVTVGANPRGVIFSEYGLYPDSAAWDYSRPILARNGGWAVFISTYRGRNQWYELVQQNKDNPDWLVLDLTVDDTWDNEGNPLVSQEMIEAERRAGMSESLIQQEFYNSPVASYGGAYYQMMMRRMQEQGRIGDFPYNPDLPVYAAFDIGYSDHTVAVFFQAVEPNKMVIVGHKAWQFMSASDIAHDIKAVFPWGTKISTVILPWDAAKPGPGGDTWASTFEAHRVGLDEICVLRKGQGTLNAEIAHVQQNLSTVYIDNEPRDFTAGKPNNSVLIDALTGYRTEPVPRSPGVHSKSPKHSWESHYADAIRYAVNYRYGDYMPGNWGPKPDFSAHDRAMGW